MKQYRVEVNNSGEAKEAISLFSLMGYGTAYFSDSFYPKYVVTDINNNTTGADIGYTLGELITLDQLRTMTKKEYLDENYNLVHHKTDIEVPEGAEIATLSPKKKVSMWKDEGASWWHSEHNEWKKWGGLHNHVDNLGHVVVWQRTPSVDDAETHTRENNHYFINVSDVDEIDFYEIAKRYKIADPAVQHILKKCLAVGERGHKDLETDLKDILKTAKRALAINGFS